MRDVAEDGDVYSHGAYDTCAHDLGGGLLERDGQRKEGRTVESGIGKWTKETMRRAKDRRKKKEKEKEKEKRSECKCID